MSDSGARDYLRREAGLLLHPTSLPGRYGIGDLGHDARRFVDFLQEAGIRVWQVLPLGPAGYGNSPYATRSAMAGNPLLISLDLLAEEGLIHGDELSSMPQFPAHRVDYPAVEEAKTSLLKRAHRRFTTEGDGGLRHQFDEFWRDSRWLEYYAIFMALRESKGRAPWQDWEPDIIARTPEAMERVRRELSEEVDFHRFVQFLFYRQWRALREYANGRGIRIMGDIPIFVALDSADVWARQEIFFLDGRGQPTVVAGVPPDYFSRTGQRWGNPLYRWDLLAEQDFGWWVERFQVALAQTDLVRIDHFRGFESYWEVPADQETAERGRWVKGPGERFFQTLSRALGTLPVVAEDLGMITQEVHDLRLKVGFPGMKVLHFAFAEDARNPYLPHNCERRYVVYTGTHDNDTTVGWFASRPPEERAAVLRYLGVGQEDTGEIHWRMTRLALSTVAGLAVVPMQDVLGLDSSSRMNVPGEAAGNWEWRFNWDQLRPEYARRLREMSRSYGRSE